MSSRLLPAGFIDPCLPTKAPRPPSGGLWLHEIKHDGFRIIARKRDGRVRLYSRPGNDLTHRFPLIVEALTRLRPRSCTLDGEAVACGDDGLPSFDLLRYRRHDAREWIDDRAIDGATIFVHACKLGLEGIVSKRKNSRYRSGRCDDWLKSKNPESAAVRREAEEDWGR